MAEPRRAGPSRTLPDVARRCPKSPEASLRLGRGTVEDAVVDLAEDNLLVHGLALGAGQRAGVERGYKVSEGGEGGETDNVDEAREV